jgi:tryptophan-rich sensory protein
MQVQRSKIRFTETPERPIRGIGLKDWAALGMWIGFCLFVGWLGSFATMEGMRVWYPSLAKPSWTPPNGVFGLVWTILYALMGTAAWLVGRQPHPYERRTALALFGIQLFFNLSWSVLFFGLRSTGMGLAMVVVLWLSIAYCIYAFTKLSKPAAILMAPYIGWVTFAAMLNFAIWRMNP